MANKDIIQELSDLGSSLANTPVANTYSVPDGYFDGLPGRVLQNIKAEQALDALSWLPKSTPYKVPLGYFDGLEDRIMNAIRNDPDYQTSEEELESISPLLSKIDKGPVYSVPEGYFENFNVAKQSKSTGKVILMPGRKLFRYAAAAMIIATVALTGVFVYNNTHRDAAGKTLAKFEKEVKKIDDVKKTDSLIDFMDAGLNEKELASNHKVIKTDDVQTLLKDVSTDELRDFNEQSKEMEDVMVTN